MINCPDSLDEQSKKIPPDPLEYTSDSPKSPTKMKDFLNHKEAVPRVQGVCWNFRNKKFGNIPSIQHTMHQPGLH